MAPNQIAFYPQSSGGGAVSSVFGRTGGVVAASGDYTAAQVTNAAAVNASNTFTASQIFNNGTNLNLKSPNGNFTFGAGTSGGSHIALNVNDAADLGYNTVSLWGFWNGGNGAGGGVSVGSGGWVAFTNSNDSYTGTVDTVLSRTGVGVVASNGFFAQSAGTQLTAAATITPTKAIHHITGATTVTTITATNLAAGCVLTLIPDTAGALGTGGNIGKATTLVAGQACHLTYDGTNFYPSY